MVITEPPVSESEKREALEAALGSTAFGRSAQLRSFLRYVCEHEMAGQADQLTEYQIAIEVLGRRKDFSLADDSSVRNRAYELRQRLEKFYREEQPQAPIRIEIPRGGYVPLYTRHHPGEQVAGPVEAANDRRRAGWPVMTVLAAIALAVGALGGAWIARPHPPSIVKEAWGPLADAGDDLLICIATNLHMIVRPHIGEYPLRFDAPRELYSKYGPTRPLGPNEKLYMEPAQFSVPLAELAAATDLANMRQAFGGGYQLLPESEAPVAALRGRNAVVIGSGTNSQAASLLLRNMPWAIEYNSQNRFAVIDHRKPDGQNELFVSQPTGDPVSSVLYGLITILTAPDPAGRPKRTAVFSGSGSAGVQAAVEYFCSPLHMREMKARFVGAGLSGFPANYQVLVRARTSGLRLISYEYTGHVAAP